MSIRPIHTIEELEACVTLQRAVWRFDDIDLVPRRMFVVADRIGGQILGAYGSGAGERLIGYSMAMPGFSPLGPYWHSHMLAVAPEVRNQGIGRALKLRQRDEALARGLQRIEWTFDPLEIKNAFFNVVRLGAIARRYVPNHYGWSSSVLQAGLPTDRLIAEWWLARPVTAGETVERVHVPAEVAAWKAAGDPRAAAVQTQNRERLMSAFAAGLAVTGYDRAADGGGTFLLSRVDLP